MTSSEIAQAFTTANLSHSYKVAPEVIHRQMDGKIIALLFDSNEYFFEIDGIAVTIWQSILDSKNLPDSVLEIQQKYEVPPERVCKDSIQFVSSLVENKLIKSA